MKCNVKFASSLFTVSSIAVLTSFGASIAHASETPQADSAYFTIAGSETREIIEVSKEASKPSGTVVTGGTGFLLSPPGGDDEIPVTQDPPSRRGNRENRGSRENQSQANPTQPAIKLPSGTPLDEVEVFVDQLIRIGEKIYKIIEAGRPVYNSTVHRTDVLPKGITEWQQLTGWQAPVSRSYEWSLKNLYGITVIALRYRILFTPGGSYNEQGRYLQNVTIVPENVYVAWGYSLEATASVPSITNAGSTVNPLAAAELMIDATVKTPLNTARMSASYYARGDGMFKAL